jgi:ketosteroid isomerase-like protein
MITISRAAALGCALWLAALTPASAQNLSLSAPDWATPLIGADITPTTGGRAALQEEGITVAARVTIAPSSGGVARIIRFEQRGDAAHLFLRRFTGHPSTGWWLWGSDAPFITTPTAAQRTQAAALVRAVMGVGGALGGGGAGEVCAGGERVYLEVAYEGRSTSFVRNCISATDAAGRLALALSEIAGSRTGEELAAAAVQELLDADRAFAAKARADGVPAAFAEYAAENALMLSRETITSGRDGVVARFGHWQEGARLDWAPEAARVSDRGDMGWTWGNSIFTSADGTRTSGRYVSIWTRDLDGNWRYALDAGVD